MNETPGMNPDKDIREFRSHFIRYFLYFNPHPRISDDYIIIPHFFRKSSIIPCEMIYNIIYEKRIDKHTFQCYNALVSQLLTQSKYRKE